ncbi:MAG: hypothetical protein AAB443_02305 [Patescibacteria group bacterium]
MNLPKKIKQSSISLYITLLPVLLVLLLLSVGSFVGVYSNSKKESGSVLSKGSDSDDDDGDSDSGGDDKDNDSDDNDNDERDEDDNDTEDKDDENEDADEDKDDDKDEDDRSSNSGSGNLRTRSSTEVEDENEDEDDGKEDENESKRRVVNPDGTVSIIETEVEDDGKYKYEIKTFDAEGNKIRVEKYENENGKEESRVKVYDATGTKLSDFELKTEDGKRVELKVKAGDTELSRVRFNVKKNELIVRTGDDDNEASSESRLRIRLNQNNFVVSRQGVDALSKFPMSVDDATGKIFVKTPSGDVELKAMPDSVVQRAQASDDLDSVGGVSLDSQINQPKNLEYVVTGTKSEKLLGLFTLNIPSSLVYDASTGTFVRNDQGFVSRILDLFSF